MNIERMTDRSKPLADRVLEAINYALKPGYSAEKMDTLLADVAAADRLARAADAWFAAIDGRISELSVNLRYADINASLDAYRARMAQGVACGE